MPASRSVTVGKYRGRTWHATCTDVRPSHDASPTQLADGWQRKLSSFKKNTKSRMTSKAIENGSSSGRRDASGARTWLVNQLRIRRPREQIGATTVSIQTWRPIRQLFCVNVRPLSNGCHSSASREEKASAVSTLGTTRLVFLLLPLSSQMSTRDVRNPKLFECAWEVANRVGGVYSVLRTKVPVTVKEFGDNYCLIGPRTSKSVIEVEELDPSASPDAALAGTIQSMRDRGVHVVYGRWLVEGSPQVVLFDLGSQYSWIDAWKADLWMATSIPTPPNDQETNDATVLGYLVAWLIGEVRRLLSPIASRSALTPCSTLLATPPTPSLVNSTSGRPASLFLF